MFRKKNKDFDYNNINQYVIDSTIIYHSLLGEGVFKGFSADRELIYILFDDGEIKKFMFPSAFDSVLSLGKTETLLKFEESMKDSYKREQFIEETNYFNNTLTVVDEIFKDLSNQESDLKTEFNSDWETYDGYLYHEYSGIHGAVSIWRKILYNPYFARIDYNDTDKRIKYYIGKHEVPDYVISWKDKRASLYYQYSYYIASFVKNRIDLVRDFNIFRSKLIDFTDTYNSYKKNDKDMNIIYDKRLQNIINYRSMKETHDIITSIQLNQYNIIIFDYDKNILVLGCAGSGKTMIMLHRLSYILFNNDISIKDVFIISPTNLLNLEIDSLSETLELNNVNKYSNITFNKFILMKYYSLNEIVYNIKMFDNIIFNNNIGKDYSIFYSENFLNNFRNKFFSLIDYSSIDGKKFINYKLYEFGKKWSSFNGDYNIFFLDDMGIDEEIKYRKFISIIKEIPIDNVNEIASSLYKNLDGKRKLEYIILKFVMNNFMKYLLPHDKTKYNEQEKIDKDYSIVEPIFNYFELDKYNSKKYDVYENNIKEIMKFLIDYKDFEMERRLLIHYRDGNYISYVNYILDYLLMVIKINAGIDKDKFYEFELFLKIYACSLIFTNKIKDRKFIFIDEIQDYSNEEIKLYRNFFVNSIFNYFGDSYQKINLKGMNLLEIRKIVDMNNQFNINENYRNAYQITEYINKEFNISVIPIGIKGIIKDIDINTIDKVLFINNSDRLAIIVKDKNIFDRYILNNYNIDLFNFVFNDTDKLVKDKINVISVLMSKGLEFEKVVVINNNMSINEMYVSYTRALNELYIIK